MIQAISCEVDVGQADGAIFHGQVPTDPINPWDLSDSDIEIPGPVTLKHHPVASSRQGNTGVIEGFTVEGDQDTLGIADDQVDLSTVGK